MDRSFLFDEEVIKASRDYVCIRLASYEDAGEAEFLKTIYVGRTGELENTVFVLLSPDTKTDLCRAGRGPHFAFRSPAVLAAAMKEIAKEYPAKELNRAPALPQLKNFRLGLNVSSCDGLPLVICVGETAEDVKKLNAKLSPLAFEEALAGKFGFASALTSEKLGVVAAYESQTGFLLIQPGEYGVDGKLVKAFAADVTQTELRSSLLSYVDSVGKINKHHNQHVRKGRRTGQNWVTEIPVTDPMSLRAMSRERPMGDGSRGND